MAASSSRVGRTPPVDGAAEAEHARAQVRVAEEGGDVGPERMLREEVDVLARRRPALALAQAAAAPAPRGTDSTRVNRSEQSSGSERIVLIEQLPTVTVVTPCRIDSVKRGRGEELGVVVRVHVEEPGHHPGAARVDACAPAGERPLADRRHAPVRDGDVAQHAGRAGAVEEEPVLDDHVEHGQSVT